MALNALRKLFGRSAPEPQRQPLRLLQLHEHLAHLDQGVQPLEVDDALRARCLQAAEAIWPQTKLSAWDARPRDIRHAYRCTGSDRGFVHIDADRENCFVIVVFEKADALPIGYLLMDIGAEYREATYECPPTGYAGVATKEAIEVSIPILLSHRDAFAILDAGEGTYMQVSQEAKGVYLLEHQMVNGASHYRAAKSLDAQAVIAAFQSYAFGKYEWAREIRWEKMEL